MCAGESNAGDHSPGDSDENIMEGGVTIRRRKKTKLNVSIVIRNNGSVIYYVTSNVP